MSSQYALEDVKGVGDATAEKLRAAGITNVETLVVASSKELASITGLTEDKITSIAQAARQLLDITFISAEDFLKQRQQVGMITTGCKALDKLLDTGVETQAITELCGEFGVGKTQIAHQLCITVQLPKEQGGLEAGALYVDTEGTFRPERLQAVARRFEVDPKDALKNVIFARAYNSDHQILILDEATKIIEDNNIKLVVVDSIISHFRSEYPGRENLAPRQQRLNKHIHQCLRLSGIYNLAVVCTNQAVADPGVFFGNPQKPTGGNVLAHGIQYRLWLRKSRESKRIAKIFDSPRHPEGECVFRIAEDGIIDADEE